MYASFAPVPNHSGAGSVSSTGSQRTIPAPKKQTCSSACTAPLFTAASYIVGVCQSARFPAQIGSATSGFARTRRR